MSHKEKVEMLIMKAIENNLNKGRREQALDLRAVYDALKFGDFRHLEHITRR
jgi:hypothetical protein